MAEVFGYPIHDFSPEAVRHRTKKLCPYNNKVPNCTKDKAENPLGVCSVFEDGGIAITCPIRFRQDWIIADDAAAFFFPGGTKWTSLTEVRLADNHGRSAGNIDIVLVAYDDAGHITNFGALEVQAVYISGNIRRPFEYYMADPAAHASMDWTNQRFYPRPDYASSSRKRLAPQLIYKGGILHAWKKKLAVAVDGNFFATLPHMDEVDVRDAELAWLIYDLQLDAAQNRYRQVHTRTVYTRFKQALDKITIAEPGDVGDFMGLLQGKLEEKLANGDQGAAPDAPTLAEEMIGGEAPEDG